MLIVDIGNCHFGSFERAKELIRAADENGADLIKGQAFLHWDIKGSMPEKFYKNCQFPIPKLVELIDYARSLKTDMFFSIMSSGFEGLRAYQNWHKITGSQTADGKATLFYDHENVIISAPEGATVERFKKAEILHVTSYLAEHPNLERIKFMSQVLGRQVGYSDHTLGIENCIKASELYGAHIIEKHLCLKQEEKWNGITFRDTIHGVTPRALARLAVELDKSDTY